MPYKSYRQQFIDKIAKKATYALETEGETSMNDIRQTLSVDYPPSGPVGGYPARRTGNLQNGVEQQVEVNQGSIELAVFSNRVEDDPRVPEWLEFGTLRYGERPYMWPGFLLTRDRLNRRLPEALSV